MDYAGVAPMADKSIVIFLSIWGRLLATFAVGPDV